MRTGGLFQFMRFVCNLPRIMRLFDFGRNSAKNYASIIRQGLGAGPQLASTTACSIPWYTGPGTDCVPRSVWYRA